MLTNLYFNSEKIQKSNEELIRLNKEIRKMYECIDDQIREEETLAMKIRIHDSFGRSLLAVRQLLEEEAEPEKMKGQLKTIRQTAQILLGNMEEVQDENKESITEKAEKLGITVFVTGKHAGGRISEVIDRPGDYGMYDQLCKARRWNQGVCKDNKQ